MRRGSKDWVRHNTWVRYGWDSLGEELRSLGLQHVAVDAGWSARLGFVKLITSLEGADLFILSSPPPPPSPLLLF